MTKAISNHPLVSVVMSVYNAGKFIDEAVASIQLQVYEPLEIIAVNDGSTDDSLERLRRYREIRILDQRELGESKTRNTAIKESRGEYLSFLDPDDVYYPGRIIKQLAQLQQNPNLLMNTSLCLGFVESGMITPDWVRPGTIGVPHRNYSPSGWLIKRELFNQIGYLDETMNNGCDFEWIKRVRGFGYQIGVVEEVLWGKRAHASNASAFLDRKKIGRYYHELLMALKK